MTLRHLEIFMAVCRTMSMSKAAEELNMSQPAVSKAISELEAFYNTSLFDRLNRRIYLTEAGSTLRQYADTILSQFNESVAYLRDGSPFQSCRLCVNVTAAESILNDLLSEIQKELPDLNLTVGIYNSSAIEQMIRNNECDIGIIDRKDDQLFDSADLYEEPLGLFASAEYYPDSTITADELLNYRLLLRESGSGNRTACESLLQTINYPASAIWESSSDEALILLAENHMGITILPESCVSQERKIHAVRPEGFSLSRSFYLVSLRNKYLSSGIRACMDVIYNFCHKN